MEKKVYVEHRFQRYLSERYTVRIGSSAKGIDLPGENIQTDIKVTSITQPQSSCPFKNARQKIYGLGYNLLKSAFKTLYGLFDKIAYFLNSYFELGIHERDVSFNHIWLTGFGAGKNHYEYKNVLNHKENFALASLYWISRDFYDKFEDSPNPRLKRISDVRNALEHKYVKVTNGWFPARVNGEIDDLALYVTEDELSALTLELMHIVREAIICVSLCVHVEEQKNRDQLQNKLIMPMPLMEYDDEWKL